MVGRGLKYSKECDIDTGLIKRPTHYWLKPLRNNSTYIGYVFSTNSPGIFCKEENEMWTSSAMQIALEYYVEHASKALALHWAAT